MVPIVSFVGKAKCGKTTFLEKLIPELVARGIRVCAVKHSHHGFSLDQQGKDTFRLSNAGSVCTMLHGPDQIALFAHVPADIDVVELAGRYAHDVDLVIAEGYKSGRAPKIEITRAGFSGEPDFAGSNDLVAVISDRSIAAEVPVFNRDDAAAVADFLVGRFMSKEPGINGV